MHTIPSRPELLDRMTALAERVRGRMLLLLDRGELTVSELCAVMQLPQSTASRHLKILADAGWVVPRRDGTSRLYGVARDLEPEARELWELVRKPVSRETAAAEDARRLPGVLRDRRTRSRQFFASAAARWDALRDELYGRRFYLLGLLGLLDDRWVVGDLGCGTGRIAESIAPFVARVVAVDDSEAMLEAARERLDGVDNVELRRGELEALPLDDRGLDAATLVLVLHHLPDPARVVAEVARVLRPGGRLLIVDMLPHDRLEYQREMGHVWAGFSESRIAGTVTAAGFEVCRFRPLPADAEVRGPSLFAASCRLGDAPGAIGSST